MQGIVTLLTVMLLTLEMNQNSVFYTRKTRCGELPRERRASQTKTKIAVEPLVQDSRRRTPKSRASIGIRNSSSTTTTTKTTVEKQEN